MNWKTLFYGACATAVAIIVVGCETMPPATGPVYSAGAVGDRSTLNFSEVVVSIPVNASYQNLHIDLAASVNQVKSNYKTPYDAIDILRRSDARIAGHVGEVLGNSSSERVGPDRTMVLRKMAQTAAQAVVDDTMQKWQHGADYRVEIIVTDLYWTDPSVGRSHPDRMGFWW